MNYSSLIGKDIYLAGPEKIRLDVHDFFSELNIVDEADEAGGDWLPDGGDGPSLVIICSFESEPYDIWLHERGFKYERDYIWLTDLVKVVDEQETFFLATAKPDKKVVVMGTGDCCRDLIRENPGLKIEYFVDNNTDKQGARFHGRPIRNVDQLVRDRAGDFVTLVAINDFWEAKEQLTDLGLKFGEDFYFYEAGNRTHDPNKNFPPHGDPELAAADMAAFRPSELLEKVMRAPVRFKLSCDFYSVPLAIDSDGHCHHCCGLSKLSMGSLLYNSLPNIMGSVLARIVWLSLVNKSYLFCVGRCHNYATAAKIPPSKLARNRLPRPDLSRFLVNIRYDESCNLTCLSCRGGKRHTSPGGDKKVIEHLHRQVIDTLPLLPNLESGNGEMLFSRYYREIFLEKYSADTATFISNGILFNEENWQRLRPRYRHIRISFSVDAATADTYQLLRGGDFRVLTANLEMAARLRREGELEDLRLSFVVQKFNYKEMKQFAHLGQHLGADEIAFVRIFNWGTYTADEFAAIDVAGSRNPHYSELMEILKDPVFTADNVRLRLGNPGQ